MNPISSATTGSVNRALAAENPIGAGRGETGSAVALSAGNRAMHPAVMARTPTANTEALQSRMRQFGVDCSVKMETVFPTTADGETTFRQQATSLTVNLGSSADLAAALNAANESLLPAPADLIEEWLAELSVKTARRKDSPMGAELALSVYREHLRQYPADAVRLMLSGYRGVWFPTWGELAERLDELTDPRLMIRDRLADMLNGKATGEAQPSRADQLAKARDELATHNRLVLRYPELDGPEAEATRDRLLTTIGRLQNG